MRSRVRERDLSIRIDEGLELRKVDDATLSIYGPDDRGGTDRLVQIVIDDPSEFGTVVLRIDEAELRAALGPAATPESDSDDNDAR